MTEEELKKLPYPTVTLTKFEHALAVWVGKEKHRTSVNAGLKEGAFLNGPGMPEHINVLGCIAEFAAAKLLDLFFTPVGTFQNADLSGNVQVRAICKWDTGEWKPLKVKKQDKDQLVLGVRVDGIEYKEGVAFEIPGWYTLKEAMERPDWLRSPQFKPYYDVPDYKLHPLWLLKKDLLRSRINTYLDLERLSVK